MSQEEVDEFIGERVPKGSFVYEIGCGGKSSVTFGKMWKSGLIGSYLGCNFDSDAVDEAREQGLTARLVAKDFNPKIILESLKKCGKEIAVLAMFGLLEKAPEVAKNYAKQARDLEIKNIVSYPEI